MIAGWEKNFPVLSGNLHISPLVVRSRTDDQTRSIYANTGLVAKIDFDLLCVFHDRRNLLTTNLYEGGPRLVT